MNNEYQVTWEDIPDDIKTLVEWGVYTKEEVLVKCATKPTSYHTEPTSYYRESIYATKSNMTKKQAEFLFEHQGNMSKWRLEMLLENGYALEANDEWNWFIKDLLDKREITKKQYDNWLDRFKH